MWPFKNKKNNIEEVGNDSNEVKPNVSEDGVYLISIDESDKKQIVNVKDYEIDSMDNLVEIQGLNIGSISSSTVKFVASDISSKIINKSLSGEHLICDIPFNDLTESKKGAGFKRCFSRNNKNIEVQGNLSRVNTKGAKALNVGGSVLNLTSYVVGQANMIQIKKELIGINDNLKGINVFNSSKFIGEVKTIIFETTNLTEFQYENINNKEARAHCIDRIDRLRIDAEKLLEQTNAEIDSITGSLITNVKNFEKLQNELSFWKNNRQVLFTVIEKLCELHYVYFKGNSSLENSLSPTKVMLEECEKTTEKIKTFNSKAISELKIDIDNKSIEQKGKYKFLAIVNKKFKYYKNSEYIIDCMKDNEKDICISTSDLLDYKGKAEIIYCNKKLYIKNK